MSAPELQPAAARWDAAVFKFEVPIPDLATGRCVVRVPDGTRLLSAGQQDAALVVWGLAPQQSAELTERRLIVVNTGEGVWLEPGTSWPAFLGTVDVDGVVWHLFEDEAP